MTNIWREVTDKWQQFCILSAFDMARNYQYIEIGSNIVSTVPQLICICRCNVKCVCMYLQNAHNYCQRHSSTHVSHKMFLSSRKDTCSSCTHCMCLHSDIVLHLQHTHARVNASRVPVEATPPCCSSTWPPTHSSWYHRTSQRSHLHNHSHRCCTEHLHNGSTLHRCNTFVDRWLRRG